MKRQEERLEEKTNAPFTMLVVEDDKGLSSLIQKSLQRAGFDTDGVLNGTEAIGRVEEDPATLLLLLDYKLPDMTGKELIETLERKGCAVPFIVTTGFGDERIAVEMMKLGARDYVVKDSAFLDLLPTVAKRVAEQLAVEKKLAEAEKALQESKRKYLQLVENAQEGIWAIDKDGHTTFVNPRMAEMLGYTADEMYGKRLSSFMDERGLEIWKHSLERRKLGIKEQHDLELVRKDRTQTYTSLEASLIIDDNGDYLGALACVSDITDRKRAEEALQESEKKMRLIIESSPVGIRIAQRSKYVYVNPAFAKIFGYDSPGEIVGLPVEILYVSEDRELVAQRHEDRLSGKGAPLSYETRGIKKNGEVFDVAVWLTLIDYEGEPAVLAFITDISEAKTLRMQLQQAQKMEAIGTLASGIAHDFNNILAAIVGYTELGQLGVTEESRSKAHLDQVLKAANRAKGLVQQILAFGRQSEREKKPSQITLIAREALRLIRASLPSTIEIRQNLTTASAAMLANPTEIHQVLMNLCTNAAHAMGSTGGVLEVSLDDVDLDLDAAAQYPDLEPGPYLRLTVSDTGHGMEPEVMERIFDPYFTTKEKDVGTGLGLAVVHGIVKSHGGAITVHSKPGKGTVFYLLFPRIDVRAAEEIEPSEPLPTGDERILFVDDEEALMKIGQEMLEHLGYRVLAKTSPVDALEVFRAKQDSFDLVITDQTMPGMTGEVLAREVMQIRPDVPVILFTGFSEVISEDKAMAMGIREFVMKPLVMRDLAQTVRKVLDE